jgi:NAD(P)-dependent dehydrogenase (short-subunit alcohol dehydrogenase family)
MTDDFFRLLASKPVEAKSRLDGQVCVITGATGIAAAAAHRFVAEGAKVFTIGIDDDECADLHDALGDAGADHAWAAADLTDEAATVAAFESGLERFGTIDGLFAVAGGSGRRFGDGPTDTISLEAWQATLDLNLTTSFLSVRETLRHLLAKDLPGGSIVVVSSVLAEHPSPDHFPTHAYATAKGAQLALVRATAARYASQHVRVNAIVPAVIDTPMSARAKDDEATSSYLAEKQPLAGGMIPADDVASAALFLLSDEARYITGQVIAVDGGWSVAEA